MRAVALLALLSTSALAAPAYVRAKGVFKIDDAGKATLVVPDKDLPIEMTVDNDGDIWVASVSGKVVAHKKTKRTVQLPSKSANSKYPVAMIAAKDGGIWALGREQLFRISADGKLTKQKLFVERLLGPASLLEVGDGVWVASENGIHQFAAAKWTTARTGSHEHLVRDASGNVWTVMHVKDKPDVLAHFDGLKWTEGPIDAGGISAVAAGKAGVYVALFGKAAGIYHVEVKGGTQQTKSKLEMNASELVIDASDRVWLRDGGTVRVFDKTFKTLLLELGPGMLPGVQGQLMGFVVAAGGPTTLPAAKDPTKVTVTGRLMKTEKEPRANTTFTMCAGNCSDGGPQVEITTDADGNFIAEALQIEYTTVKLGTMLRSLHTFNAGKLECCLKPLAGNVGLGWMRAP